MAYTVSSSELTGFTSVLSTSVVVSAPLAQLFPNGSRRGKETPLHSGYLFPTVPRHFKCHTPLQTTPSKDALTAF